MRIYAFCTKPFNSFFLSFFLSLFLFECYFSADVDRIIPIPYLYVYVIAVNNACTQLRAILGNC